MRPESSETVWRGRLLSVTLERWGEHEREIVDHPGAVTIVAEDGEGCVTLVCQLREAARTRLLELPAGTLEPGEEPLAAAKRELAEETGLHGGDWREAASFWTTPGFTRERMTVFFAYRFTQNGVVDDGSPLREHLQRHAALCAFLEAGETMTFDGAADPGFLWFTNGPALIVRDDRTDETRSFAFEYAGTRSRGYRAEIAAGPVRVDFTNATDERYALYVATSRPTTSGR